MLDIGLSLLQTKCALYLWPIGAEILGFFLDEMIRYQWYSASLNLLRKIGSRRNLNGFCFCIIFLVVGLKEFKIQFLLSVSTPELPEVINTYLLPMTSIHYLADR